MFESFFDAVFIFIAVAIFIGRMVVQVRKKAEPPPRAKPRIPVHFEDENERAGGEFQPYVSSRGASDYIKKKMAAPQKKTPPVKPAARKAPAAAAENLSAIDGLSAGTAAASVKPTAGTAERETIPAGQRTAFNLSGLSPLKQAVVMAEILGPPKGIEGDLFQNRSGF